MATDLLNGRRLKGQGMNSGSGIDRTDCECEVENHGTVTILLVEDEAFVRRVTAEVLASAGYRLITASGGAEALEVCRRMSKPVNLLLADVIMPGMNGRDLAAEFEILRPQGRVLLMSGYSEQLALSEQCAHDKKYMAKPFSISTLLRTVHEVLDTNPQDSRALVYPTPASR